MGLTFYGTLGKIDGLAASGTGVGSIEFIRENLFLFAARGAFAGERTEIPQPLESGTMRRCTEILGHFFAP